MRNQKNKLPENIEVRVSESDGCFFAELPDYHCFTEANSLQELIFMVNDLIYEIFRIPKKIQNQIKYLPPIETKSEKSELFTVMTTPNIYRNRISCNAC